MGTVSGEAAGGSRHPSKTGDPLRAAVVGAGRISEQHLGFLQRSPMAELVGVCDANRTLASYMARRFGGAAFTALATMLEATAPDVVHVLTPPHLHVPMAMAALDSGAHVVVEKPMALDEVGREELLRRAAESGRTIVEDHNYRFNRPMMGLEQAVSSGLLGRLVRFEVAIAMPLAGGDRYDDRNLPSPSHRLPAGFIHEFITHMAYLAVAIIPDVEVDAARWDKRVPGHPSPYDDLDASVRADGVTGHLRFTSLAPRSSISVSVTGTEGSAEAEMIFGSLRVDRPRAGGTQLSPPANAVIAGAGLGWRGVAYVADRLRGRTAYEGMQTCLRRTYQSILEGSAPPVTPDGMRRAGQLVEQLVETMP